MARKNAIINASQDLTIDPGASGDSYIQFSIAADDKFRIGVDDSDSDKFKIADANDLATANLFVIDSNGHRTMPLLPAFQAYVASDRVNVTGDGTIYTIVYGAENFDLGGDFDGTSTFTAPVTGRYHFIIKVKFQSLTAAYTSGYIELTTTSASYQSFIQNPGADRPGGASETTTNFSVFVPMTASDTAVVKVSISGDAKTVEVDGQIADTFWMGYLAC